MNHCVKITRDDDGNKILYAKWCYVIQKAGGSMALCSGQFFGMGESSCEYKERSGKITCPDCIEEIKRYQRIKL